MSQWFGILISLTGQTGSSYGMLLQKSALNDNLLMGIRWWVGVLIFVVSEVVTATALGFATPSILGALQSYQLVVNALLAPIVIPSEALSMRTALACFGLILSCFFSIIIYGETKEDRFDTHKMQRMFARPWVIAIITLLLLTLGGLLFRFFRHRKRNKVVDLFSLGIIIAITATATTLLLKSMFELLHTDGTLPMCIMLLLSAILVSAVPFTFTNVALNYYEALSVVPICNSLTQVCRIVVAGLFFNDFVEMSVVRRIFFFCSVGVVVTGTFIISLFTHQEEKQKDTRRSNTSGRSSEEEHPELRDDASRVWVNRKSLTEEFVQATRSPTNKQDSINQMLLMPSAQALITNNMKGRDSIESQSTIHTSNTE